MAEKYIATEDGTSIHTGSTIVGPVAGTLSVGSNSVVTINGKKIMVEDGTMDIPSHKYAEPDLYHSHNYSPDTFFHSVITIDSRKIVVTDDSYSGDATNVDSSGQSPDTVKITV